MKKHYYLIYFAFIFFSAVENVDGQDSRTWATYYGGNSRDGGFAVATDATGNVYMAGITSSLNNISSGGFQNAFGGGNVDAYLVKFDSTGTRKWGTYYGGTGDEMTFFGGKLGIATDGFGNVFLAGLTNSTAGIASGGFQNTIGGTESGYLVKFDSTGSRAWATYYGGTFAYGFSVATDEAGNVYLAGTTGSSTDISFNGFQNSFGGSTDAYLVKFDAAGNRLWGTYYGGPGSDDGYKVTTDKSGNVYLAGFTSSTSAIASGGYQNAYGGGSYDDFLVKFDALGTRLWATYYGGQGDEMALFAGDIGLATDDAGNVYLAGMTTSTSGIASGGFQNSLGGGTDAFLTKFDSNGLRQWATYYGGSDEDKGYSVAVDGVGDVILAGRTSSANNISSGGFQNNYGGSQDAFIAKFDPAGNRLCASYFGASGVDDCNGVAAGNGGAVYLAGGSENVAGIAFNGFQNSFGGSPFDGMLVKFTSCASTTGIRKIENTVYKIYPSVNNGIFFINNGETKKSTVQIIDVMGNEIYSSTLSEGISSLVLPSKIKGIYFVRILDGNNVFISRLVVE